MKNDKLIASNLVKIQNLLTGLGDRPKVRYVTNGILKIKNKEHNINVLNTEKSCVLLTCMLLNENSFIKEASDILGLGTDIEIEINGYTFDEYVIDIKQRLSVIQWDKQYNMLNSAHSKLSDLMSNDAKTESAIDAIANELGIF